LVEIMARTGMTWEARLAAVGRMHRAGVRLVAGADAGISAGKPHGILPEAVVDLVGAGLLLVDGDPLTDISARRRVSAVVVGGQTVRRHPWDPAAGEQA